MTTRTLQLTARGYKFYVLWSEVVLSVFTLLSFNIFFFSLSSSRERSRHPNVRHAQTRSNWHGEERHLHQDGHYHQQQRQGRDEGSEEEAAEDGLEGSCWTLSRGVSRNQRSQLRSRHLQCRSRSCRHQVLLLWRTGELRMWQISSRNVSWRISGKCFILHQNGSIFTHDYSFFSGPDVQTMLTSELLSLAHLWMHKTDEKVEKTKMMQFLWWICTIMRQAER